MGALLTRMVVMVTLSTVSVLVCERRTLMSIFGMLQGILRSKLHRPDLSYSTHLRRIHQIMHTLSSGPWWSTESDS